MAKSLLKKAKKAAKKVKKEVSSINPRVAVDNFREHVEKLAGERRDCATIWTLIKSNDKYTSKEEIINLLKAKNYETLLGEFS